MTVTFDVPEGSTVSVGTLTKYYIFSFLDPMETETGIQFRVDQGTTYFYRVQNPDGVTYWDYTSWKEDATVKLTKDDLHIGDKSFTKDTVYRFDKNVFDRGGIYLNINTQGYKSMSVGETYELNSFRNWFAIESYMNAKVALPDMHYQVIDVNGKPSDVLTITPDEKNSNVATMTANKEGTAIVLVTYDAMIHMQGQTSNTANREFSAIWPELTGVFIVTVGSDGTGIQTNMVLDRMDAKITKDEQYALDAEHDILFYLGSEGASYSFKPEEGCTVTVARSTVGDAMTFNGFTSSGVSVAADGTVTITGLTTGRHIVKVAKDGAANYQVITARGVSYDLVDANGTVLTDEAKANIKAGDTVYLQYHDLISPKEKLSGAYNFNFSLYYEGQDGTFFKSDPGGNFGVYDFSGNPARQKIAITIPKYWDGTSYSLSGAIKQGGFSGVPTHRGITYAAGTNPGFNAPSASGILSRLPDVSIPVAETTFLTGKLVFQGSDGSTIDRKDLTVTMKDSDGIAITLNEDGTFKALAEDYSYVIMGAGVKYTTGSVTVTEDGENVFTVTLTVTSDAAWDGTSTTEPQAIDGVYQIGTGAELAWFVTQSKTADVSGVLTASIDLGEYPWLDVTSGKKVELDGKGFEITGLNAQKGLFSQIGSGSHIQNLTLRGVSAAGGSVTGYASGSGITIENCFSYVTISGNGNNVGGIVGYVGSDCTVRNCANFGSVTGSSNVGGIIGTFVGSGNAVTGCYNTGSVTSTGANAGGVFGSSTYGVTIDSCYNTGSVTGGSNAGGIGGTAKGATNFMTGEVTSAMIISHCYSTGTVTGGSSAFGKVDASSVEISKCYALGADDNAELLTKDADLGDSLAPTCGGYPAETWQENVSFHETGAGTVTAPTCTEGGYTIYTCTRCKEIFRDDYTAALGHTPKDGTEIVKPAYRTYVCDRCGTEITEWNDVRLQHVTLPEEGVSTITMADGSTYPWQYDAEADRFQSTNVNVSKSTADTSFTFTLTIPGTISFDYGVSSEKGYDKFTATLSNGTDTITVADGSSGEVESSYSGRLAAGTWTLTLRYNKDSGGNDGDDLAYVSGLTLNASSAPTSDAAGIYQATGDYMTGMGTPGTGSVGGEWLVLGLARSGRDVPGVDDYYQKVVEYVNENINASNGRLNRSRSTENSRIILALTAIGKDVTNVNGHNLLQGLDTMSFLRKQGTNGPTWALLALDSHNYTLTSGDVTREALVDFLVGIQMDNGGWYISYDPDLDPDGPTADVDMTAMVVQALAPYYNSNDSVKAAVDKALVWLASRQGDDGDFGSSETVSQVIVALCALGIDPVTNSYFTKGSTNILDVLCSYYVNDGKFAHEKDGGYDQMATEQAYYALAAYYRLKNQQTFLYDMSDVTIPCTGDHKFGEWTVTKEATCTEDGSKSRTCSVCGTSETQTIAAPGHKFGDWTVTKEATCTEAGVKSHTCSVCQTTETKDIAATGHSFGKWVVTKKATRTEEGLKTRTCSACGATETKVIPALGNRPSSGTGKPAEDVKSSQTGDNSQMILWMGGVMLSAAALVVLNRRKKNSEE